jgi:chemotaxis protein methyltransferase CheR
MSKIGTCDLKTELPADILTSPALLFLYYRIEQILGIKAGVDSLKALNEHLEKTCRSSFIENPATYEYLLTSREQIFTISRFITVNETYFFREGVHFSILESILPELAKLGRPIQICSAAVSIGCEAYSIAMLLDYHNKKGLNFEYTVDAFDVDSSVIETAKKARYTSNALRNDGSSWRYILDLYLEKESNEYVVSQNIARKVRFFPHNIIRGLDKQYDIIFFRNALIYFSNKTRLSIINSLSDSLFSNGLLFMGISETSAVRHPLLVNRFLYDGFYFQKINSLNAAINIKAPNENTFIINKNEIDNHDENSPHSLLKHEAFAVQSAAEITISCDEISDLLKYEEGKPNAEFVVESFNKNDIETLTGSRLAACAIFFLNSQDFIFADKIITYMEKYNTCAYTRFLRGEYYYLQGYPEEAEEFYHEASIKDKYFWAAFYRIAVITAEGNPTRHEYKVKKTIESIELWQSLEEEGRSNYECFIGGFSPDYFLRILEKKLS